MWVAMGNSTETEVIDIVENIFEHNDVVTPESPGDDLYFEPEFDQPDMDVSYETVEIEMEIPSMDIEEIEVEVVAIETEMEMEMELEIPEPETQPEVEEVNDEPVEETTEEPTEDVAQEPEAKESVQETETNEDKSEDMEESEDKSETEKEPVKKQEQKEKAAKKIVKKMGDKGRYDTTNQTKTLIVMQVLGDTKSFFESQKQLEDRLDFFTDYKLPDTQIENNNIAQWVLFQGSDGLMNDMIELQWQK